MIRNAIDLVRKHLPSASALSAPSALSPAPAPTPSVLKRSFHPLDAVPPILFAAFLISFVWDSGGLIRILSVSGLIGYGTNWLAITMLFRPQHRRPLLGHGLIPAQKERIVERLSTAVMQNLINPESIREKLTTSGLFKQYLERFSGEARELVSKEAFKADLNTFILDQVRIAVSDEAFRLEIADGLMEHLDDAVSESRLEKMALSVYKKTRSENWNRIVDKAVISLPELIEPQLGKVHEWLETTAEDLAKQADSIEQLLIDSVYDILIRLDLKSLMAQNLRRYDEGRLENLIKDATLEQLRYIQSLGGVLGTIGGLVIWSPIIAIPGLAASIAMIWLSDALISRWKD
jgi:uncharacterized membrane protein YheB (UPF0754 family)